MKDSKLKIGEFEFNSRLIMGTGKYANFEVMNQAHEASGADVVTVALRRVNFEDKTQNILHFIDTKLTILPNTAGCYTAEEAIRTARLARELGMPDWIKLEVIGDQKTLMPDNEETLKATKILVEEGFIVLPYINADPLLAKRLEEIGCATVMPLASPIGTGQGIKTAENIRIIIEQSNIPVVVDAGLGVPSEASRVMEMGADCVLVNTAIALAENPVGMAGFFCGSIITNYSITKGVAHAK